MKDTVLVFARVPRLGVGKRRLARGIGARGALRFQRAVLARLLRALQCRLVVELFFFHFGKNKIGGAVYNTAYAF